MGDITYNTLHKPGGWTEMQAARGTPVTHRRSTQNPMWGAGEEFSLGENSRRAGPALEDRAQEHMRIVPLRWLSKGGREGPVTVGSGGPLS